MRQRTFIRTTIFNFLMAIGCLLGVQNANATHLRAGEITVTRKNCSSLEFTITITVYTNTGSPIHFSNGGAGALNFGDGSPIHHPPQIDNSPVPGFGPEYGYVSYSTTHTFSAPGKYAISYLEVSRMAGSMNISDNGETPFYVDTEIEADLLSCDNSPRVSIPPINKACTGVAWYHNPGAYDPDGDSLSYEMGVPRQSADQAINDYRAPNVKEFYDKVGIAYSTANEAGNGPPTFSINPVTGMVTWDAPGAPGEYTIAFIIREWRKIGNTWISLGYVTRDMMIEVEDCNNRRPGLTAPTDLCVAAGTVINTNIYGTDPDFDSVKIEAFSQVFSLGNSPATFAPSPAVFQATSPTNATANFTWSTSCDHIKAQPYQIVFKETDFPPPNQGAALVNFKTWNIRVAGAPPQGISVQSQPGGKAKLQWNTYTCGNATTMQVWRRVNSFPFTLSGCNTGMPDFLGFDKIADVPIGTTQYIDTNSGKGLAPGAMYCYRLVAGFPQPSGGESYTSEESCFTVLAAAPVITNVSISKTGKTDGQNMIAWLPPLASDIDQVTYPPPYQYTLYRAEGFSGDVNLAPVFTGKITETTFLDNAVNTQEKVYNYRVVAFSNGTTIVDTSASASSVRLELTPHNENIELNWNADVPWSNRNFTPPYHKIFRGPENSTFNDMQLIDSVDVNAYGYHYADSGQWNSTALNKTQTYCYCVGTVGAYGNIQIGPMFNLSQITCVKLGEITGELASPPDVVHLYPNPVNEYFMVNGIKGETGNAAVMDLVGRSIPVYLEKDQDALKVDVQFLPQGMYIFKITDGNTVHQIKFVKQ